MTGIEVVRPAAEVRSQHDRSGRVARRRRRGRADTCTVRLWPGCSTRNEGDTEPNGANFWVETCHGTVPLVPPSDATSPKITPVQVPATGYRTSTLPKLPTPWGSEWAANRPSGSIRISRTRELFPLAGVPGVGDRGVQAVLARPRRGS